MSTPLRMASNEVGERDTAEAAVASQARRSWGCIEQVQDCRRGVHLSFPVESYLRFRGMDVSTRRRPSGPFFVWE